MFKIGDFSKLTLVSIRMLRYYDEIDLFKPVEIDHFTNYRYYSAGQIPDLKKIVYLRNLGFKADDIKQILNEEANKQIELLQTKKMDIIKEMEQHTWRLKEIEKFIRNYNQEESRMKYDVVIRKIPSYQVVALRDTMPKYTDEGQLWGKYMGLLGQNGLELKPGGMCYAMFFNDGHADQNVDIEIGDEVVNPKEDLVGLKLKTMEPIETAATLLVAGEYYPNIEHGFNYLATWLEENNYDIAGPSRTVYIKGPDEEQNPENYLTEIILPVNKN